MSLKGRERAEARCEPSDRRPRIAWITISPCRSQMEGSDLVPQPGLVIEEVLGGEKKKVTSSKTSASLLRTSSGSDWKEGTLGERERTR